MIVICVAYERPSCNLCFFFYCYGDHRDLHVLTHTFPTRRSSDLQYAAELRAEARSLGFAQFRRCGHRRGTLRQACARPRPWRRAVWPVQLFHEDAAARSDEHTFELQPLMRTSYAVFCFKKNNLMLARVHPVIQKQTLLKIK